MNNMLLINLTEGNVIGIIVLIVALHLLGLLIFLLIYNRKYKNFVLSHSKALKRLKVINNKYDFEIVPNLDMSHSYDNENFYNDISCFDYLVYQLVYIRGKAINAIKVANDNEKRFEKYQEDIKEQCNLYDYGDVELLRNIKKLHRVEEKLFKKEIQTPDIEFDIEVKLILTNINGDRKSSKSCVFDDYEILEIMRRLDNKRNNFYQDKEIWDAICRVERGKVTNKMRFSIYARDDHRCCKCGRRTDDLEIDHIIPVSKGGKSTYNNLQTLCHSCNVKKGNKIE